MCSGSPPVIKDDGFESVSLGEDVDACDICQQDTGQPIRPCEICLKPYFDSATTGFNEIPEVIHTGQKGHEQCFKKSHEILAGSIFLESHSSAGSNLTLSPNIPHKSLAENISDLATEVQAKVAENILWIFRRHCSPTRCQSRTITGPERSSMSPQWGRKEFSDCSRLSASMTNLNADLTESRICRKIDGADLKKNQSKFKRRKSEGTVGKVGSKINIGREDSSGDETSHEVLKRTDSWNRLKPTKKRNIVITVTDGDIDFKDIVEYSPKDLAGKDGAMLTFQNAHSKEQDTQMTKCGKTLSTSSIEEEENAKKFPTYTKTELVSMTKDELHALSLELSKRIHAISSKLVDLVQERHSLREEVDVRHIFIEKLLKLNLASEMG
ncbi:uncharacterized protein LOC135502258 [Lineus longissimus]|uniref:uncharacterized protein LOC135502258 n=1 Tax=Lineus longissimus TaxID=88925 RepID=UPI002B4D1468